MSMRRGADCIAGLLQSFRIDVASFGAAVQRNAWSSGAASFVMWLGHLPSRTGLTFPDNLHRGSAQQQRSASVSAIPVFSGQVDLQRGHLQYCRCSSCQ